MILLLKITLVADLLWRKFILKAGVDPYFNTSKSPYVVNAIIFGYTGFAVRKTPFDTSKRDIGVGH